MHLKHRERSHNQHRTLTAVGDTVNRVRTGDSPVEGVSVHGALSVLELPQVEETLSEPRVGPVQAGAPDSLANAPTQFHKHTPTIINTTGQTTRRYV